MVPPSVVDEEREPEEDEDEDEGDEKEEEERRGLKNLRAELVEGIKLATDDVYDEVIEEYGIEDGTFRSIIEADSEDMGGRDLYTEMDVLFADGSIFGLYGGRVFELSQTYALGEQLDYINENADDESPADSFEPSPVGVREGRSVGEAVRKVEWVQEYLLRNAPTHILRRLIRRTGLFDAFIDKDKVKEIIRKRTGSGKMKGGKFFLTDLWDMLRGKRVVEH